MLSVFYLQADSIICYVRSCAYRLSLKGDIPQRAEQEKPDMPSCKRPVWLYAARIERLLRFKFQWNAFIRIGRHRKPADSKSIF